MSGESMLSKASLAELYAVLRVHPVAAKATSLQAL